MSKKIVGTGIALSILGAILGASAFAFAQTNTSAPLGMGVANPAPVVQMPSSDELLQLQNLMVQGVAQTSAGWEIIAGFSYPTPIMMNSQSGGTQPMMTAPSTATNGDCRKFASANDSAGVSVACPVPPTSPTTPTPPANSGGGTSAGGSAPTIRAYPMSPNYRIEIDANTRLILRDRTMATINDFSQGDAINVYGFYNTDGTIRGLIVRNLSKPAETTFVQLNNVNLISVSGALPNATLIVAQQISYPCFSYGASGTAMPFKYPCPYGLDNSSPKVGGAAVPQSMMPVWGMARKYEVHVDANTILLNRLRGQITLSDLKVGQSLNIYGETTGNGIVNADLVRDLDTPPVATVSNGTVTQVNADGSFVMQLDDGTTVTVQNPIAVGVRVQVKGVLDRTQNIISQVSSIAIGNQNSTPPMPVPLPMLRIQSAPGATGGTPNGK